MPCLVCGTQARSMSAARTLTWLAHANGLSDADRSVRVEWGVELRVRRQQHDHGRAHIEARHFGIAFNSYFFRAPILAHDRARVGRNFQAAPHGFDARNEHRTDHHNAERLRVAYVVAAVAMTDQTLVA